MEKRPPPRLRVDVATGATRLEGIDATLAGPIPVQLARSYNSANSSEGSLGRGWSLGLETALLVTDERIVCEGGVLDGTAFAPVAQGSAARQEATGLVLENHADAFALFAAPSRVQVFLKKHGSGGRFPLSAIRAGTGQVVEIERQGGRISRVNGPGGRSLQLSSSGGSLSGVSVHSVGRREQIAVSYMHESGLLRAVATPDGKQDAFEYAGELLVAHRARDGAVTYAEYDADGRCLCLWQDDAGAFRFDYDPVRQTTRVVDSMGGQTLYRYTNKGQVLERVDAGGRSQVYYYGEDDQLIGHGSLDAATIVQRLDPKDLKLVVLQREARTAFVQFGEHGLATAASDVFDNTFALDWDQSHSLIAITTPTGGRWAVARDQYGRTERVTSPEGRASRVKWESDGVTVEGPDGTFARERWNSAGRVVDRSDAVGRRVTWSYDSNELLTAVRHEGGYGIEFQYDANGLATGYVDSERRQARLQRDRAGSIRKLTDHAGLRTTLDYDALGRISGAGRDGAERSLSLGYDVHGRLTAARSPNSDAQYEYTDGTTVVTDGRGRRVYNALGEMVTFESTAGEAIHFGYGSSGELATWEAYRGETSIGALYLEYDEEGRPEQLIGALSHRKPEHRKVFGVRPVDFSLRLAYDRDGVITTIANESTFRIESDSSGRPVCVHGAGTDARLTFDGANRLVAIATGTQAFAIHYDVLDRPISLERDSKSVQVLGNPSALWIEIELAATGHGAAGGDRLQLHVAPQGVALVAALGPVSIPIWCAVERRSRPVCQSTRLVVCALRGPSAAMPGPGESVSDQLAAWKPWVRHDIRSDECAIPASRDLGWACTTLDDFFLTADYLETKPLVVGAVRQNQTDQSRDSLGGVTGDHRRGYLRPNPWPIRAVHSLLHAPDLLGTDAPPSAEDVFAYFNRIR